MKHILGFYTQQGVRTKVRRGTFDKFPDTIREICTIIRYLLVHPENLHLYNLHLPEERIRDRYLKTIRESVAKIQQLEDKPLTAYRQPEKRVVNICKHFAMFLCSVLREKGIPARCRCGFATYFNQGWFSDHWICEYWNKEDSRWIMVDAQMDNIQILKSHIRENLNFFDMPKGIFFPGGVLWKLYRQELLNAELCGYSKEEKGEWYIRGNMLRDFFALNKVEYTYQETSKLMEEQYHLSTQDIMLLDTIADITTNIDKHFEEATTLFRNNKDIIPQ